MKIKIKLPNGTTREIEGKPGDRVMQLMRANNVGIMGDCGGALACATCHVHVAEAWLAKVGSAPPEESDLLDMSSYHTPASRLSCQIVLTPEMDGLEIDLQPDAFEG